MMNVRTIDYFSPTAASDFVTSLHETGFAVITHHPISTQLIEDVYAEWLAFFSSDAKFNYPFDKAKQHGYGPFKTENSIYSQVKNLLEFYNVYPDGLYPKEVSDKALQLHAKMVAMAEVLLAWLDASLPEHVAKKLSMPLHEMVPGTTKNLLRIVHYPAIEGNEDPDAERTSPHEDSDLITLLPTANRPGLQILNKQNQWQAVASTPGSIIVNAGEMLKLCTDGYLLSTTHRVTKPTGDEAKKPRISVPLFVHPRDEVILSGDITAHRFWDDFMRANGVK